MPTATQIQRVEQSREKGSTTGTGKPGRWSQPGGHDACHPNPDINTYTCCWCMCSRCWLPMGLSTPVKGRSQNVTTQSGARIGKCICSICPCNTDSALGNRQGTGTAGFRTMPTAGMRRT